MFTVENQPTTPAPQGADRATAPAATVHQLPTNKLAWALEMARRGLAVFPLQADSKLPLPGSRGHLDATTDADVIRAWWQDPLSGTIRDHNIGASPRDGRHVIIDLDEKDSRGGIAAFTAMGGVVDGLVIETPSGGVHVYCAGDDLRTGAGRLAPGIDTRGADGYVVAPGSTIGGLPYKIVKDGPPIQVPAFIADKIGKRTERAKRIVFQSVESDQPQNIARAIQVAKAAEPAVTGCWHDCGYRLGCEMARIGLSPEKAVEVLAEHWVPRGSGFKSEAQFERDVLGGYHDAVRDGGHGVHAVPEADRVFDGVRADRADDPWQSGGPSGFNGSRIVALTAQECATVPTPPYIVKGLLARGQVAAIAALPGSGKSCFTPLLAYRMSQGKMVFGRRTKPGRVAYFGLEDEHGMAGRVTALSMKHGEAADFRLFLRARNLLTCADEREEVKRMVRAGRPDLVVFDTVRAGWRGLSENDSDAMSAVLAFVRELTQGADGVPGPAVILIHHTTKSGGHTMAGSGVLEADADVTMFLEKDAETNVVTVSFGKNRNGESTGNEMFFSIEPVRIKMDADGDPETRPVAVEVDPKTVRRDRKLSPTQAKAVAILEELAGSAGADVPKTPDMIFAGIPFGDAICVLRDEWQTACELRGLSTAANPADRSRVFRKALQELVALKRIVQLGDHIYLMKGAAE